MHYGHNYYKILKLNTVKPIQKKTKKDKILEKINKKIKKLYIQKKNGFTYIHASFYRVSTQYFGRRLKIFGRTATPSDRRSRPHRHANHSIAYINFLLHIYTSYTTINYSTYTARATVGSEHYTIKTSIALVLNIQSPCINIHIAYSK